MHPPAFSRHAPSLIVWLLLSTSLTGCSPRVEDSPEYLAACHGAPLGNVEAREKALYEGYDIERRFDCIGKASFEQMARRKAEIAAANTPEAIAARKAERERQIAEEKRVYQEALRARPEPPPPEPYVLRLVDANSGTLQDLASIPGVGPQVAAQIVEARKADSFKNWNDMITRVHAFSAARIAYEATVSGLTVNGESLPGVPPDQQLATMIKARFDDHERRRICREKRKSGSQELTGECNFF